jgi:subfamily B ATP-binding cassette protein MsbA
MKPLLRLRPYLRPYLWQIVASGLLAIPLSALRFSPAPLIQRFVDDLLVNRDPRSLYLLPTLFLALALINFVVRFLHYYLLRVVITRVNQKLKNDLFEHLVGLSADHFTRHSVGSLVSRVGADTQYIDGALNCINIIIREPITFLFLFGYALSKNWRLTLITLLIFPPLAWIFVVTGRNLKRYIKRMQEENARLFSTLQETFSGIRIVQAFRLEKYVRKRFRERSDVYAQFLLKSASLEEAAHPMIDLLNYLAIAVLIYFGGREVIHGTMKPGELIGFFTAFALMMNPVRQMNDVNMKLSAAASACTRIFEIFDWRANLVEPADPLKLRGLERSVEFDHVAFSYPDAPQRPVLKDVSFTLDRGHAVALVGSSGAGKSSLVNLLPRIFDVTSGAIRIDGRDIREYALEDLRKQIAVVSQDVFLFNDTVEENIRCGRLSATPAEIREAARRAHALEFIESFPDGFKSVIGDRGQKLSGGERQRISIARAFLRQAPLLLLDEATSSLDSASERAVQEALDELMENRTTIVIAHRLSTIRHVDRILVVKEGLIVESGTHEELLRREGEYFRFHRLHEGAPA